MNRLDDRPDLDTDLLLATIYAIQTDLKLLTEHLARRRNADLSYPTILALAGLRVNLQRQTPSLRRH